MLAFIISLRASAIDLWRFTDAVIQDARALKNDMEKQYGPLGF
jgi:hypothetical protein